MGKELNARVWLVGAVVLVLLVIVGVAGKYISVFSTYVLADQEKWGQFGDYFGGVLNPILSFCAFIALLFTLRIQLSANDDGERRHSDQLREQRLFQMVGLMNENANNIRMVTTAYIGKTPEEYVYGHQAVHHAAMKLQRDLAKKIRIAAQIYTPVGMEVFESGDEAFKTWRKTHWSVVGPYIDSVFLILGFVLNQPSGSDFKQFSLTLLRVQLSESERLIVWYSAMFTAGYSQYLAPLVIYGFLDDQDQSLDDPIKAWRTEMVQCSLLRIPSKGK